MDAVSAAFGLLRKDTRVRKGVNPWGYAGGTSPLHSVTSYELQGKRDGKARWSTESEDTLEEGISWTSVR